jgi:hypothetical protein
MPLLHKENFKIAFFAILFILIGVLLASGTIHNEKYLFINGILSSIQLIISVYLTVAHGKSATILP